MLEWLSTLYKSATLRDAVVAKLQPIVEASRDRLNGIPSSVWLEPYMIGLMAMLITVVAEHEESQIGQALLCRVQTTAWRRLTALQYQVGEDILLLSASRNEQFLAGCLDANRIATELYAIESLNPLEYVGAPPADQFICPPSWTETFESYIANRI